ncbi:MAG: RpiB/LacA/LacB family sugar-phosphate isomerase [Candidatus Levybacteria bacterium]|nr:RpiB/LacA/LacB family sugar-phosphate isomerase [Candidatus Levybacteria bacterium]
MKIYLGTDHAGFELKEHLKQFLSVKGYDVIDDGALIYDKDDDYPDFCAAAARHVAENPGSFGFVFGKSGTGELIVANKVKGVRCGLAVNEENVRLAREHNDANMLSFGSVFATPEQMESLALLFITTPFSGEERHKRRIEKIREIERFGNKV